MAGVTDASPLGLSSHLEREPAPGVEARPDRTLAGLRSILGSLDLLVGILLAVALLPLVVAPLLAVFELLRQGESRHAGAATLAALAFYGVVWRAVRRGSFSPAIVPAAVAAYALALCLGLFLLGG
jgi:hypothetical protein